MKKKLAFLLLFVGVISLGVNLWNPISGSLTRNVKYDEGVQVQDTFLTKGLNIFEGLAGSGSGVATLDNNGKVGFGTAASISPWTGNGTNVYLRDSTENVGIGTAYPGEYKLYTFGKVFLAEPSSGCGIVIGDGAVEVTANDGSAGGALNISFDNTFYVFTGAGTVIESLGETGFVSIGKQNAAQMLDVGGNILTEDTVMTSVLTAVNIIGDTIINITRFNAPSLPTDSTGLATGDIYRNGNVIQWKW